MRDDMAKVNAKEVVRQILENLPSKLTPCENIEYLRYMAQALDKMADKMDQELYGDKDV